MIRNTELSPNKSKSLKTKADHYLEIVAIATENGGECLDNEYVASNIKMNFRCVDSHEWSARPNDIKRGTWCPSCRSNKTENLVRQFFETVFNQPFKGSSPEWLQIEGERKCILDGLNTDLKIAFEYHGEQHYHYIPHFHDRANKSFEYQQERDKKVRSLCESNGIKLIEIKYLEDGYSRETFISYLTDIFKAELDITVTAQQITKFKKLPFASSKINELKELAKKMKGECLSVKYLGTHSKAKWKCEKGHEWEAVPKSIKKGHWCPYCNGRLREGNTLEEISAIARSKGGQCLSISVQNLKEKLSFICSNGHSFETSSDGILYTNKWCPYCAKNKLVDPMADMHEHAKLKGGKFLSTVYVNSTAPLMFECGDGHTWNTTYSSIRHRKSWCPKCHNKKKGQNLAGYLNKPKIIETTIEIQIK